MTLSMRSILWRCWDGGEVNLNERSKVVILTAAGSSVEHRVGRVLWRYFVNEGIGVQSW